MWMELIKCAPLQCITAGDCSLSSTVPVWWGTLPPLQTLGACARAPPAAAPHCVHLPPPCAALDGTCLSLRNAPAGCTTRTYIETLKPTVPRHLFCLILCRGDDMDDDELESTLERMGLLKKQSRKTKENIRHKQEKDKAAAAVSTAARAHGAGRVVPEAAAASTAARGAGRAVPEAAAASTAARGAGWAVHEATWGRLRQCCNLAGGCRGASSQPRLSLSAPHRPPTSASPPCRQGGAAGARQSTRVNFKPNITINPSINPNSE